MRPRTIVLGAVLLVAAFAVIGGGLLWPRPQFEKGPWADAGEAEDGPAPLEPVETLGEIPADRWLNAPASGFDGEDLRGDVVLIEYWTYLCTDCKNVEEWMKKTHAELAPDGLRVLGVHTPEFDVERKVANVRGYLDENGIAWPVAIDNDYRVWRTYNTTRARPAFFVYDRQGRLVYRRAGERAVHGAREAIEKALAVPPPAG